ncbi:ArsR/SmtB family transcription factor [Kitasatospora sp. NPDC001660]
MTPGGEAVDEVLGALADPMRRRILDVLAVRGTATATTLAAELPVSRQAVVKHLALLDRAGLVTGHRSGREVRYVLAPQSLKATAQWMASLAADWDLRLQAIKRLAESAVTPDTKTDGY